MSDYNQMWSNLRLHHVPLLIPMKRGLHIMEEKEGHIIIFDEVE
ncbi:MAG TPA: hypothetical protein PKW07_08525 [Syntrophorhabdaceae bacterium]|nr:hypothetical protein [Syntrophorhabdaceae bacterium]